MPRRRMTARARAVAWWRRCHADPEKRAFRRIGLVSFGVVGASVILAKVTQDTPIAGMVRALAITMFGLAAIALLGVVIMMGEEVVEEMDATDPTRVRRGGAYGPRIKRFFRDAGSQSRAWVRSLPARVVALRHGLTRDSLARFAVASIDALGGVPPAGVALPRGAGRLARMHAAPEPSSEPDAAAPSQSPEQARRRALTASELAERSSSTAPARRPTAARTSRAQRPSRRTERAAARGGRTSDTGGRSTR